MTPENTDAFTRWLAASEARHLADLRIAEVTRALRALSAAYVERRRSGPAAASGRKAVGALESAGKRAAFALFYGPLHYLTVDAIVRALTTDVPPPTSIIDLGCGTGAAGAAWALAAGGVPVSGIDRHPWAVEEARWTYQQCGIPGRAKRGEISHPTARPDGAIVAAYVLNELPDATRTALEERLHRAAGAGAQVLVVEPIARAVSPWWDDAARRVERAGGRADEWRLALDLPPLLRLLDRSAGLDHRVITARSLYLPGAGTAAEGA